MLRIAAVLCLLTAPVPRAPAPFAPGPHSTAYDVLVQRSADGNQWTRARPEPDLRVVRLRSHDASAKPSEVSESIATRYRPERLAELHDGCMLVAGRVPRTGNTVIEAWTITGPGRAPGDARPRGIVPARVARIDDLYDEDVEGRRGVQRMHALPVAAGVPTRALVQFADSHALYTLDVVTHELAPVASPTALAGAFEIPLLARPLSSQVRLHRDGGVRAILGEDEVPADRPSLVVLVDAGADGTFDSFAVMSLDEFRAAGYLSAAAWAD